ncbi:beta-lactamase/transpeptidase-like protein [Hygrophoropsis aurantiaca]|uniref:Beta-lactamase/transpeptidase-like protein n=1 Tax=Hygrophoropsis aurantiaca TaxID=72124 RepID=A0ACB8APR5_9AGAM|nr:beta-lactamase/transpeptidase-like protein [Hygrophoropsis aurantiaca]
MKAPPPVTPSPGVQQYSPLSRKWGLIILFLVVSMLLYHYERPQIPWPDRTTKVQLQHTCRPPPPPYLAATPPSETDPTMVKTFDTLENVLQNRFSLGGLDSLSVAVVGSNGSLFEGFWGRRRANETNDEEYKKVNRDSVYRVASISKLFTALETLILRDRGILNLDDPVSKVLPEFTYHSFYAPITYRSLMSHMSGLGVDWPPGDASAGWPRSLDGRGPPIFNGLPFPSHQDVFDVIAITPPVLQPYTFPVYSNTGYRVLGMANVAANQRFEGPDSPATHAELVSRDIFEPLALNGSSFLATDSNSANLVISSFEPSEVDQDFLDATNPTGGQMSSLSDLIKLMQTFIAPNRPESLLSPYTLREWMRPLHSWFDDFSEVGAPWEIYSSKDKYGRTQKIYQKLGELAGHHTAFTINPVNSYGVIVLTTGPTSETIWLTNLIIEHIQSAFDTALEDATREVIVGSWISDDEQSSITIDLDQGSLYVSRYMLNGTDVLGVLQYSDTPEKLPLWSTLENQYRLIVPAPAEGCLFNWVMLDSYGYIDGYSVNTIHVLGEGSGSTIHIPGVSKGLRRQ